MLIVEFSSQFHIYVLIFSSFCGKRILLIVSDICDGILELKNLLGCGVGMICNYVNSKDLNFKSKCPPRCAQLGV